MGRSWDERQVREKVLPVSPCAAWGGAHLFVFSTFDVRHPLAGPMVRDDVYCARSQIAISSIPPSLWEGVQ